MEQRGGRRRWGWRGEGGGGREGLRPLPGDYPRGPRGGVGGGMVIFFLWLNNNPRGCTWVVAGMERCSEGDFVALDVSLIASGSLAPRKQTIANNLDG